MATEEMTTTTSALKLTPRISRSRCFKLFKWTLFTIVVLMALATVAGGPWYMDLTRELLQDLNKTSPSMAQIYSGEDQLEITDELVYIVVGVSVVLTILYLTFGAVAAVRESFCMSLTFGLSLILCFAGSIFYYTYLLFLVNMVLDLVLGILYILFALAVKRADRLSPETHDEFEDQELENKKRNKVDEDKV